MNENLAADTIVRKNNLIDNMRMKLNRYEFAIKEGILFLSKPIEKYEQILKPSEPIELPPGIPPPPPKPQVILTPLEATAMECVRLAHNYLKKAQKSVSDMDKGNKNQLASLPKLSVDNTQTVPPVDKTLSNPNSDLNGSSTNQNPISTISTPSEKDIQKNVTPSTTTTFTRRAISMTPQKSTRQSSVSGYGRSGVHSRSTSYPASLDPPSLHDEDEGDLGTGVSGSSSPHLGSSNSHRVTQIPNRTISNSANSTNINAGGCPNCRQHLLQIDRNMDVINTMKVTIANLDTRLSEEKGARDRLQVSKDILETEIEELTQQLFEEANQLASDAARGRDKAETECAALQAKLKELQRAQTERILRGSEFNLSRSTDSNEKTDSLEPPVPSSSLPSLKEKTSKSEASTTLNSSTIIPPMLPPKVLTPLFVDGVLFLEFKEHVRSCQPINGKPNPNADIMTSFMARCFAEDVEPCLLFSNYTPSSGEKGNPFGKPMGMNDKFKKRLVESVVQGGFDIMRYQDLLKISKLNNSDANQSLTAICCVCTLSRECEFRLGFVKDASKSPTIWSPMCRFCKDRVISVADFYFFLSHVRAGTVSNDGKPVTLLNMFRHAQLLRRRMASARIGSGDLFEHELLGPIPYSTDATGIVQVWENRVQIVG